MTDISSGNYLYHHRLSFTDCFYRCFLHDIFLTTSRLLTDLKAHYLKHYFTWPSWYFNWRQNVILLTSGQQYETYHSTNNSVTYSISVLRQLLSITKPSTKNNCVTSEPERKSNNAYFVTTVPLTLHYLAASILLVR